MKNSLGLFQILTDNDQIFLCAVTACVPLGRVPAYPASDWTSMRIVGLPRADCCSVRAAGSSSARSKTTLRLQKWLHCRVLVALGKAAIWAYFEPRISRLCGSKPFLDPLWSAFYACKACRNASGSIWDHCRQASCLPKWPRRCVIPLHSQDRPSNACSGRLCWLHSTFCPSSRNRCGSPGRKALSWILKVLV